MVYRLMAEEPVWYRSEWVAKDEDEMSEVLSRNASSYGECQGINKAIKTIREVRNEFLDV